MVVIEMKKDERLLLMMALHKTFFGQSVCRLAVVLIGVVCRVFFVCLPARVSDVIVVDFMEPQY